MAIESPITELKLSDRLTVEVQELNGKQMDFAIMTLDSVVGEIKQNRMPAIAISMLSTKVFAVGSICKINGTPVSPYRNIAEYSAVSEAMLATELKKLLDWASPIYMPMPEEVGKEQEDQISS